MAKTVDPQDSQMQHQSGNWVRSVPGQFGCPFWLSNTSEVGAQMGFPVENIDVKLCFYYITSAEENFQPSLEPVHTADPHFHRCMIFQWSLCLFTIGIYVLWALKLAFFIAWVYNVEWSHLSKRLCAKGNCCCLDTTSPYSYAEK